MLFNHQDSFYNTINYWHDEDTTDMELQSTFPHTIYRKEAYHSQEVRQGQELFTRYGGDEWFTARDIEMTCHAPTHELISQVGELVSHGVCLSDFAIDTSTVTFAGLGVFSVKQYKAGDVVSVTPVIVLPKDEAIEASGATCVLINYCITDARSSVALLPITVFALVNHAGVNANLEIDWFFWDESSRDRLHRSAQEVSGQAFADMYISYRATRDIAVGDEFFIDYGPNWVDQWNEYVEAHNAETETEAGSGGALFRHPIEAPFGKFPTHWLDLVDAS
jgi:hypothetical protein